MPMTLQEVRDQIASLEGDDSRRKAWVAAIDAHLTRAIGTTPERCVRYRLLGPEDVVQLDDEFIDDNAVDWVRVGSTGGGRLFVGMSYRLGTLKQARRKIATPPTNGEG